MHIFSLADVFSLDRWWPTAAHRKMKEKSKVPGLCMPGRLWYDTGTPCLNASLCWGVCLFVLVSLYKSGMQPTPSRNTGLPPPLALFDTTGVITALDSREVARLDAYSPYSHAPAQRPPPRSDAGAAANMHAHARGSTGRRRAFVTLLVHAEGDGSRESMDRLRTYSDAALTLLYQLQLKQDAAHAGRRHVDSVLAVTPGVPAIVRRQAAALGIAIAEFPMLQASQTGESRYSALLTKLLLWNMTQYDEILYVDSDMVLQGDLAPVFDACDLGNGAGGAEFEGRVADSAATVGATRAPSAWMLCAVQDHGAEFTRYSADFPYFNAGVFVLQPRRSTLALLMQNKALAEHHYSEQNLLNAVFRGKWQPLGYRYNALKFNDWTLPSDALLVHQKSWYSTTYCIAGSIRGYYCCSCAFEWARQREETARAVQLHFGNQKP